MICAAAPKLYFGAVARRIEIELTSARPDGTWTWRVAGAKQPKGTLDGSLLAEGSKVGDVVRAEAEFELDGTIITAVFASATKRTEPERLEILGTHRPFEGVTTSLVPKGSGRVRAHATSRAAMAPPAIGAHAVRVPNAEAGPTALTVPVSGDQGSDRRS